MMKVFDEPLKLEKNVGHLVLTTEPAGVTVFIDGKKVGVTKRRPCLPPGNVSREFEVEGLAQGKHTLKLVRDKHEIHREVFEIDGDQAVVVAQKLKRLFVKDWEIRVRGERWVGSKVEAHRNGDVTMEVAPGISRRFSVAEIEEQKAYVKEK